jgi:MFS family permease
MLMMTILCFSVFTLAGALAANVWELALFRFLAGIGIGGEWSLGGIMVAEDWPEERRVNGAAYMHTGYYFGTLLAALANHYIGARYGWRAMFLVGGSPALLVAFIRYGIREPGKWTQRTERSSAIDAFLQLFSMNYRRRTILNALFVLISMVGLWAGSVYIPTAVTQLAVGGGRSAGDAARLASNASILLSLGTIPGCLVVPFLVERLGRRLTLGLFYGLMAACIGVAFGYVLYLPHSAILWFMPCVCLLGLGGASFCVFTVWLPEQYPTSCRASAFAFARSNIPGGRGDRTLWHAGQAGCVHCPALSGWASASATGRGNSRQSAFRLT